MTVRWAQTGKILVTASLISVGASAQTLRGYGGGLFGNADSLPAVPAMIVTPVANSQVASLKSAANLIQIQAKLQSHAADVFSDLAEVTELNAQKDTLETILEDKNSDPKDTKVAKAALAKIERRVAEINASQAEKAKQAAEACMQQFSQPFTSFFFPEEADRKLIRDVGFSCKEGERLVYNKRAEQVPIPCFADPDNKGEGAVVNPPELLPASSRKSAKSKVTHTASGAEQALGEPSSEIKTLGQAACLNSKGRVSASAVIHQGAFAPFATNQTRYKFDGEHVTGWIEEKDGELVAETTITGGKRIVKRYMGSQLESTCEHYEFKPTQSAPPSIREGRTNF